MKGIINPQVIIDACKLNNSQNCLDIEATSGILIVDRSSSKIQTG
ncbi:hypothetical protein K110096F8_32910 [Dielma fastidiosa]